MQRTGATVTKREALFMTEQHASVSRLFARECITTALIQLTLEKPLSEVSITELAKRAGVSRMTFYRNYSSKKEILTMRLSELVEEYRLETRPYVSSGESYYGMNNLVVCLEFFRKNSDLIECLQKSGLGNSFSTAVSEYVHSVFGDDDKARSIELDAFVGALFGCYEAWAARGFEERSEIIAAVLSRIFAPAG
jgi:AcrR family transcriptional regulator